MATRPEISVVITDLDNTLFDWVGMWHRCFDAMLQRLASDSGVAVEVLEQEFKVVHERHGTAEYSFAIEELPSLRAKRPHDDLAQVYAAAIAAYRDARRDTLKLYPGVLEALAFLRGRGCLVVGYTESLAFYSGYRVRRLGLDGLLDYLFSPEDHDIPEGLSPDQIRFYPTESYTFRHTIHLHTPPGALKPNPAVLRDILDAVGAKPGECLYVGDSLLKDVQMAKAVGVLDVHAKYGEAHDRPEYALLRRVTHWKAETVAEEQRVAREVTISPPTHVLEHNFAELIGLVDFTPFRGRLRRSRPKPKLPTSVLEAWKKTVDVQQHFNDLELRVRNLALTVATTTLGAVGYLWTQREPMAAQLVGVAGLLGWAAFWLMDRHWYHRLLLGSVKHGIDIESRIAREFPELALTKRIGEESPWPRFGRHVVHSSQRLTAFYAIGAVLLVAAIVVAGRWPHSAPEKQVIPTGVSAQAKPQESPSSPASTVAKGREDAARIGTTSNSATAAPLNSSTTAPAPTATTVQGHSP